MVWELFEPGLAEVERMAVVKVAVIARDSTVLVAAGMDYSDTAAVFAASAVC